MPNKLYEIYKEREKQRKEGKAAPLLQKRKAKYLEEVAGARPKAPKMAPKPKPPKKTKPTKRLSKRMQSMYSDEQLRKMGYK